MSNHEQLRRVGGMECPGYLELPCQIQLGPCKKITMQFSRIQSSLESHFAVMPTVTTNGTLCNHTSYLYIPVLLSPRLCTSLFDWNMARWSRVNAVLFTLSNTMKLCCAASYARRSGATALCTVWTNGVPANGHSCPRDLARVLFPEVVDKAI